MAQFKIGDKVIHKDYNETGTVGHVKEGRGRVIYNVIFQSGERYVLESDLTRDDKLSDPFERCKCGIFDSYTDYVRTNTCLKIRNSNKSTISSLKASKTLFNGFNYTDDYDAWK